MLLSPFGPVSFGHQPVPGTAGRSIILESTEFDSFPGPRPSTKHMRGKDLGQYHAQ